MCLVKHMPGRVKLPAICNDLSSYPREHRSQVSFRSGCTSKPQQISAPPDGSHCSQTSTCLWNRAAVTCDPKVHRFAPLPHPLFYLFFLKTS